jgi:hypothetical protein
MGQRKRTDDGRFTETVTPERVLDALRAMADPVATASDVASELGCTREAARVKLVGLEESGRVERKKVGGAAVVWWPAEEESNHDADPETRLKRLSNELGEPIAVGEQVYESGDAHALDAHDGDGEHDPDGPFFGAPALDAEDGEPIEAADTDEILGDALADEADG